MEQALVSELPLRAGDSFAPPYAPSWLNRFTDWVERLPVPAWVFYLGAWVVGWEVGGVSSEGKWGWQVGGSGGKAMVLCQCEHISACCATMCSAIRQMKGGSFNIGLSA